MRNGKPVAALVRHRASTLRRTPGPLAGAIQLPEGRCADERRSMNRPIGSWRPSGGALPVRYRALLALAARIAAPIAQRQGPETARQSAGALYSGRFLQQFNQPVQRL